MANVDDTIGADECNAECLWRDAPNSVTVPAKLKGYNVKEADIVVIYDLQVLNELILNNPIKLRVFGNVRNIILPLSDTALLDMCLNFALETINFGGTTQQWESLYGDVANNWTHVEPYAPFIEPKDITFTVKCTNGSITYPKN